MTHQTINRLHRHFSRPHGGSENTMADKAPENTSLPIAQLLAESIAYKPGYLESVIAASFSSEGGTLILPVARLETLRRQFAHGCCGS
jgi:hypothetical protein